jgi:hypothetical protein
MLFEHPSGVDAMCSRYGKLDDVTDAAAHPASDGTPKPGEGLSQFASKVLDQLSLTAWLPAAMLVGCMAVLLQMRHQKSSDIATAVQALTEKPLGTVIVLTFSLVLSAIITQAFSFEAIRMLEGYWGGTAITARLLQPVVWRHRRHQRRLIQRVKRQRQVAFEVARSAMWTAKVKPHYIEVLEDDFFDVKDSDRRKHPKWIIDAARLMGWRPHSSPALLDALDRSVQKLSDYPEEHRVLPTRLGNVLRAREDKLQRDGGELEGLVMRSYEHVHSRLMVQHDQFRNRLEMYCTLVVVFLLLAPIGSGLLAGQDDQYRSAAVALFLFLMLAIISYRAAIASARGYGVVLGTIAGRDRSRVNGSNSPVVSSQ